MEVNLKELNFLIQQKFDGKKSRFAKEIGVSRVLLSLVLNKKVPNTSKKLCDSIIKYCEANSLEYRIYINLP